MGGRAENDAARASAQLKEADFTLREAERRAKLEVESKHVNLAAALSRLADLEQASKLLEEDYRLLSKEYRLGLVNNLEVLQTMNSMQDTKRNFDRMVIQTKLNLINLEVATESGLDLQKEN